VPATGSFPVYIIVPDGGDPFLSWKEFWTFLFLKLSLLLFLLITCVSLLSGCAKKVYDYKELKWSQTDMDEEEGGLDYLTTSRTTSVTLMPFDHTYLRRLRLKHFLLRPRKLNLITTRVKSLPNTPNSRRRRMRLWPKGNVTGDENLLLKSISLSDTNLERHRKSRTTTEAVEGDEERRGREKSSTTRAKPTPMPSTSDLTPRVVESRERKGGEDSTSYTGSDMNSTNDLEMDYYDYDIQNAGNIPGSYLLEPAYVFWTDSMLDQSMSDDQGDQGIELLNTSTSIGTSSSLFTPEPRQGGKDSSVMETSFDTLDGYHIKFADDEEDEDGDTRTISDSLGETQTFLKT